MTTDYTLNHLRAINVQRCEAVFHPLNSWSLADWATAMAGECGEACNIVKKIKRLETGTNTAKDPQSLAECTSMLAAELADLVIYADLLAARANIDLQAAVLHKFNEVSDRMGCKVYL